MDAQQFSHLNFDPSREYRYRKMREFSSKPFKFDHRASSTLHMSDPNALIGGVVGGGKSVDMNPFGDALQPNSGTLSKKTRDFIGENLIDIENTLKALNLDFLQTFSELEKNDSAETLFGETYAYESTINPKILSTALKLTKFPPNQSSIDASPRSVKSSSQFSPLDKSAAMQAPFNGLQYLTEYGSNDKMLDGKRSSTPDTGFASRETTTSSRRGSQKSSYSPQESHFSPIFSAPNDDIRTSSNALLYSRSAINQSSSGRQRSMSFTENYELNSPVLSEPQSSKVYFRSNEFSGENQSMMRTRARRSFGMKPKSIRARNLRRMSYNPTFLVSSSSSSSSNELEHCGIAQSECDIRSKSIGRSRLNQQPLNRKAHHQSQNSAFVSTQDKLYGSNASIKSAPHFNYANERQLHQYFDRKYNFQSYDVDDPTKQPPPFDRMSRGSSRRRARNNFPAQVTTNSFDLTVPPSMNFAMYTQFDVSKLTGKSPTTQSFIPEAFNETSSTSSAPTNNGTPKRKSIPSPQQKSQTTFQWPEKIHVSAVQSNSSLWPSKTSTNPPLIKTSSLQRYSSDSSSSTETDFPPHIPPSPAHE